MSSLMKALMGACAVLTASTIVAADAAANSSQNAREQRLQRQRQRLVKSKANYNHRGFRKNYKFGKLSSEAELGKKLFLDKNLSLHRNQACESCHTLTIAKDHDTGEPLPALGFVDDDNVENLTSVSDGSDRTKFGSLNAPSVGYAAFSPAFHWDAVEGLYVGGQFWNGRARSLSEQAKQPFLNPVEMAMPSKWAVVSRLRDNPSYYKAFRDYFDIDLTEIPRFERAPDFIRPPGAVLAAYDAMVKAIAAYESESSFNRFTSKYDFVLAGLASFTPLEAAGEDVFNGKAMCNACHISDPGVAPDGSVQPPLFTDFTYDNIGAPRNVNIPGNPAPDPGLGGRSDVAERDPSGADIGKHKVMPLRNIAITPPYGHNGVFKTLEEITHFYNTRDVLGHVADINSPGYGVTGWPAPEVPENVNADELGDLGLTADEEKALVAFMRTLTDGYPEWGGDPNVPPGTPSPFEDMPFPPVAE